MALPGWVRFHALASGVVYLTQFFLGAQSLGASTGNTGNVFAAIGKFVTFQTIAEIPAWFSFLMFVVFALPWLLLMLSYVFQLAGTTAGLVVVLALGGVALLLAFL